jgi:hypothetical protein
MNPGSIAVPPETNIEEANSLRRSIGAYIIDGASSGELDNGIADASLTFNKLSNITSARLFSSMSPSSKNISAARSLTHPGIIKEAFERTRFGALEVGGPGMRMIRSVADDCCIYISRLRIGCSLPCTEFELGRVNAAADTEPEVGR